MKYKRILLKLSGGALGGGNNEDFCKEKLENITNQIIDARENGIEVAVLVGGGNIFRGRTAEEPQRYSARRFLFQIRCIRFQFATQRFSTLFLEFGFLHRPFGF